MGSFILIVLDGLIALAEFLIIAGAIVSWLVAFGVINIHNPTVYRILSALDAVTRPLLAPFRRFIPPIGGMDITPVIALIVLEAVRKALLPWIAGLVIPYIG